MEDSEKIGQQADSTTSSESSKIEMFLELHSQNQHRLSAFVHTLVPDWQDAEDLIQDTLIVLWRKFDEFVPGTNFFSWAAKIAQFEVLNYRRHKQRQTRYLDENVLTDLADTSAIISEDIDRYKAALSHCMGQLKARDQEILRLRYSEGGNVHVVSQAVGRSPNHVHRLLREIRSRLLLCVRRRITQADY